MLDRWTEPPHQPIVPIAEKFIYNGIERVELGQFSRKQRAWLMRRDTDEETGLVRCQFFGMTESGRWLQCPNDEEKLGGTSRLHAHHITAQGFWERWFNGRMGEEGESPHQPWNGIVICFLHHVSHPKAIHPDYYYAKKNYGRDPDGFRKVAKKHGELADEGIPYWDTSHDQMFYQIASSRTEEYLERQIKEHGYIYDPWPSD